MSEPGGGVLVIGVGNVLLRDDGVGVHTVRALARLAEDDPAALPPGTRLVDGGTQGIDLLPHLDGAMGLVLVDAVDLGLEPGTVSVLRGDGLTAAADGAPADAAPADGPLGSSSRVGGVGELLSIARLLGVLPRDVVLVGVQAAELEPSMTLSPTVDAALPAAVEAVRSETCAIAAADAVARASGLAGAMA